MLVSTTYLGQRVLLDGGWGNEAFFRQCAKQAWVELHVCKRGRGVGHGAWLQSVRVSMVARDALTSSRHVLMDLYTHNVAYQRGGARARL